MQMPVEPLPLLTVAALCPALQAHPKNPQFHHPLTVCDVTGYATEYAKSNGGVGPYTVRLHGQ